MSTQHIQKDSSLTPAYICYDLGGSEAESRQTEALLASPGPLAHSSDHDSCPELYLPSHHIPTGGQCPQRRVTGRGGLALGNQHAPKSERWPARNWAELGRTKHARLTGRSLAALYMFSDLNAPGRRSDRIQSMARRDERNGRPRLCPFVTSALTLFWKVYILFFLVTDDDQSFFFTLASAVKMGFCVCQPLQIKMEWGTKERVYVSMSQITLCHTQLFSHFDS